MWWDFSPYTLVGLDVTVNGFSNIGFYKKNELIFHALASGIYPVLFLDEVFIEEGILINCGLRTGREGTETVTNNNILY